MSKLTKITDTNTTNITIDELYVAACSGDLTTLKSYFSNSKSAEVNRRYKLPTGESSLIMAAFRNKFYNICTYLIDVGETITDEELKEIHSEAFRALAIVHIFNTMRNLKDKEI